MNIFFITLILVILLVTLFLFTFFISYFYYRSSSGIIFFRIDNNNYRVLRLSEKYNLLSTPFDAKQTKFKKYSFLEINSFLEYFDEKSKKMITDSLSDINKTETEISVKINKDFRQNFTLFERIIAYFDKTIFNNKTMLLKIKKSDNLSESYCSLYWSRKDYKTNNLKLINLSNNKDIKLGFSNAKILGFLLKPEHFNKVLIADELIDIYVQFNLSKKNTYYFCQDGILFFISKKKNLLEDKNHIQLTKNHYSKIFTTYTFLEYGQIKEFSDLENIKSILQFSLYNIFYNSKNYNKNNYININSNYINLNKSIIHTEKFKTFHHMLQKYQNINNNIREQDFTIDEIKIVNYNNNSVSTLKFLTFKLNNSNIGNQWMDFFNSIYYEKFLFEKKWYDSISKKENLNLLNKNSFIKISQETFLKETFNPNKNLPIPIIYSYNNLFNTQKINDKININYEKGIIIGLYINTINKYILDTLKNIDKLSILIIGNKITKNMNKTNVFYEILNLINNVKNKNFVLIYENPPANLDELIKEKLRVKMCYFLN
ncbi:MHO_4530 family protein [Mycoplasma leonicaptivi]|uniref:MHO_4530 family protein n=1 Tax=Mycoplasma leonicaptivi TaxID=36742 RepID=UPI0004886BD6|nr:hypothetical protein [Mycoplasma leonicaptivi]